MSTAIINLEETAPRPLSEEGRNEQVRSLATWAAAELAHANRLPHGRVRSGHLTREELHTLYTAPGTDTAEVVAGHDQNIATHLEDAARNLRAAAEILRSHRQLTSPRP